MNSPSNELVGSNSPVDVITSLIHMIFKLHVSRSCFKECHGLFLGNSFIFCNEVILLVHSFCVKLRTTELTVLLYTYNL